MTDNYNSTTDNILNRINYGMPSFGYHVNYFTGNDETRTSLVNEVLERVMPEKNSDMEFLDSLLEGLDEEQRSQVINRMISERTYLSSKIKNQIESAKDHLRYMKTMGCYSLDKGLPVKDITKLYNDLLRLSGEEDIKAWKDISFLKVKLWDEGMTGGGSCENS